MTGRIERDVCMGLTGSENGCCKIAVKVIDIFGNDTTKVVEVKM